MAATGTLVLVVGPSGAGKDTLINKAREALWGDAHFVFPRRIVTRSAIAALEDHDTMSDTEFSVAQATGAFALSWQAHGLSYGLPRQIDGDIAVGRDVVVNVSRRVIVDAVARYPGCRVVLIDADMATRARRLAGRGRESERDIAARLAREGATLPEGVAATRIDNSGALDAALAAFLAALGAGQPSQTGHERGTA